MNLRGLLSLVLIAILLTTCYEADAQRRSKYKKRKTKSKAISHYKGGFRGGKFRPYAFASFNVNALNYFGDLAPINRAASTDVSFTRPGFGGNIGYKFTSSLAMRAGFNYGRIKGDDITSDPGGEDSFARYDRNLSFRNDIKELHAGFEYYLFPNHGGPARRPNFNIYLFAGVAIFHHEPKGLVPDLDYTTGGTVAAPQAGEWVKLRKLGTEGQFIDGAGVSNEYSPFQFSIPLAVGATFRLPGPFEAAIEFGYRYLFTDYIDDVSDRYVPHHLFDDDLARIMADRSAEPVAAWENITRAGYIPENPTQSPAVGFRDQPDGNRYYSTSSIGGGNDLNGAIRGNPDDNDIIFMTTLRLTYIFGQVRRSAKFR